MSSNERSSLWTALSPAMPWPQKSDVVQAMAGGAAGIAACALSVWLMSTGGVMQLFLIAPLGATAVLVFVVPNSPLAQPWSAILGNTLSAICGVAAVSLLAPPFAPVAAVTLAFAVMMVCRALHPPGGAVALLFGLTPGLPAEAGIFMICLNTAALTGVLVLSGIVFHRFTGRKYPFRTSLEEAGPPPQLRIGLNENNLSEVLFKLHQSANLGAVDLARLVAAVEAELILPRLDGATCADAVSSDRTTVRQEDSLGEIVKKFGRTDLPALPVTSRTGRFLGLIRQKDLLGVLAHSGSGNLRAAGATAAEVMQAAGTVFDADLSLGKALPIMIRDRLEIVPVCENGVFLGVLTRSALMEALTFPRAALNAA